MCIKECEGYKNDMRQVVKGEGLIYMVLEYGDIDLARLLARHEAAQREGGATELDENFIRLYWQQMLQVSSPPHPSPPKSSLQMPPSHIGSGLCYSTGAAR